MPSASKTGTGRRVPRHTRRADLLKATRAECAGRFESLFGRGWDAAEAAEWKAWLKRNELVEREARRALAALRGALREAEAFYVKHPVRYVEDRRGLRVQLEVAQEHVLAHAYLDKETLPPGAADHLVDGVLTREEIYVDTVKCSNSSFFATGVVAKGTVPGYDGKPEVELTYSGELTGLGDSMGFVMHAIRARVERFRDALRQDLGLASTVGRTVDWETRLAVIARWDQDYAPGDLVGSGVPGRRLTPVELAAISILCGSTPSFGRGQRTDEWTPARVIDVEAKYIVGVRKSVEGMRKRTSIPRLVAASVTIGTPTT